MKKIALIFMSFGLVSATMPIKIQASNVSVTNNEVKNSEKAAAHVLLNRLDEINKLDKSNLTLSEKENLGKEVNNIRLELTKLSDGVYLSVGALIVILILVIILL